MNRVFKVVFNRERGKSMVVNEVTRSHQVGKKTAITVAVVGALMAGSAFAENLTSDDTVRNPLAPSYDNVTINISTPKKNALEFVGNEARLQLSAEKDIKLTATSNGIQFQTASNSDNFVKAKGDLSIKAKGNGVKLTSAAVGGPGGSLSISAKNITIEGGSAIQNSSSGVDQNKGVLNIVAQEQLNLSAKGVFGVTTSHSNAETNLSGKDINIILNSSDYHQTGVSLYGTNHNERIAVDTRKGGTIKLGDKNTQSVSIVAIDNHKETGTWAVAGRNAGTISIQANQLQIEAINKAEGGKAFAIGAYDGANIGIASEAGQIIGDIEVKKDLPDASGSTSDQSSLINLGLKTEKSHLQGNIFTDDASTMNLSLAQGAAWTNTKDSQVTELKLDGGIVNINLDDKKQAHEVSVDKLVGTQGTLNVEVNKTKTDFEYSQLVLEAQSDAAPKTPTLDVNLKGITSDNITPEQFKKVSQDIVVEESKGADGQEVTKPASKVQTTTSVEEGDYNGEMKIVSKDGKPGEVIVAEASSLMKDSLALASAGTLSLNRILMNDVRKRLGDIRVAGDMDGAWARYDGGKLSGDDGLENKFHTIQLGYDMALSNGPRVGMAASYTKGDTEYKRGDADMNAYSLAAYSVWMADNGMFADVIARVAKAENDMKVDGSRKGSLDSMAYSVSGEFGWRFDLTDMVYVEPQVEATYTYIDSDSMKLGSSRFEFDNVDSLMGRAGFAAGFKCPADKGDVYVRMSAVHEFLGDAAITGGNGKVFEVDGKDTWVEYGIGANFNVNKNTYVYADLERTSGATLDEDWRANVGVRYNF